MPDDIFIEHRLAYRDHVLLARLVRVLERWTLAQVAQVPPELRVAIDQMAQEAEALAQQMAKEPEPVAQAQEPQQQGP